MSALAEIRPAPRELADLAAVMRPGWNIPDLTAALRVIGELRPEARTVEQHWCRALRAVARLLTQPGAHASDLFASDLCAARGNRRLTALIPAASLDADRLSMAAEIRTARQQLVDLAARMRPGWPAGDFERPLHGVLTSRPERQTPEQHWCRAFLASVGLLTDPEAEPAALLAIDLYPVHHVMHPEGR